MQPQNNEEGSSTWLWVLIPVVVIGALVAYFLLREPTSEFTYRM